MSDIKALEYPTLKVPYETLNKKFRATQKIIDKEASHVTAATAELEKSLNGGAKVGQIKNLLGHVVEKLNLLKRKADETLTEEVEAAMLCKRRLDHLKDGAAERSVEEKEEWANQRVDRMLVEHLLRSGYYDTALKLADHCDLRSLTNIEMFLVSREVEDSLKSKDTSGCLSWCHDNKSKLRKLKSTLEFSIRQQEFIELIRKGHRIEAVKHAKKHFSSVENDQLREVQQVMMLLVLPTTTNLSPYKDFFDWNRWKRLVEQFRFENYRLYTLSPMSVFSVTLQAGLCALKTPHCYRSSNFRQEPRNHDCPVCHHELNTLAQSLPFAHCAQSRLICYLSGNPLNENNLPLMLPNGFVYGEVALKQMALSNKGKVSCPRTGDVYDLRECEKVYVM